jgi:hypothetical protein
MMPAFRAGKWEEKEMDRDGGVVRNVRQGRKRENHQFDRFTPSFLQFFSFMVLHGYMLY